MFDAFETLRHRLPDGREIAAVRGGSGPVLLLLHGHPQTHAMWHAVAGPLARRFTVVAADLPGYGDSSRPPADARHEAHSKRRMAADVVDLMRALGFERFDVCAHDRGARVAHRMVLDHGCVSRLMLLDIAPTLAMYAHTTEAFARAYWHWFFLIQPAPLPERLIEADPRAFVDDILGRRHGGLAAFAPEALAEYRRCIAVPGSATSICEDYRASASIDLEHDRADRDAGHRIEVPLRVLWGARGVVGRCFDVMALWRAVASNASGCALDCGHYVAEECPAELLDEIERFFEETTG